MKTTVGFPSSPNVVVGDTVAANALDQSLRLSPVKSMRDDGKKQSDKVELMHIETPQDTRGNSRADYP